LTGIRIPKSHCNFEDSFRIEKEYLEFMDVLKKMSSEKAIQLLLEGVVL
jgi:hypothetical protein